jgi:pimeloyl-ACP methyl ester carboxylesterase
MRMFFLILLLLMSTQLSGQEQRFDWQRFEIADRPAFMILPPADKRQSPLPWVMYAPTFDRSLPSESSEGWMFEQFLNAGIAIAGVDVGESYGSPAGVATYNALYDHLTSSKEEFARQACLLARSRGGLMLYNWAVENPDKVACIAGIYPVCDLRSYPGIEKACGAYGLTADELTRSLEKYNPVDRLQPLADAQVPIFHIHGDVDVTVPLQANSEALAHRYRELGGSMEVVVPIGQGHNMWEGFFHCDALVNFVIGHASENSEPLPTPIAHWRLDEVAGDIARDSVGGHHGKIVGAQPTTGHRSGALLFERAQGDHVVIEYSPDFELATFTISAQVKLTRPPTFSGILGTRFGKECTFDMKVNGAKVHGDIGDGNQWIETAVNFYADDTGSNGEGGDLELDHWYQIVYVIDGKQQECRLYLDADLKKTIPFQGTPRLMQSGQQMRIGCSSPTEFMDGMIDEITIWPTALSSEQVQALQK